MGGVIPPGPVWGREVGEGEGVKGNEGMISKVGDPCQGRL